MASSQTARLVLVTGPPGVGKTTLVRNVCEALKGQGLQVKGFYTEDVRLQGRRIGFDVVTLDGERGQLARISQGSDIPSQSCEYKVGQYTVNLQSFERLALPVIRTQNNAATSVCVIDEIGKMELFSDSFKRAVKTVLQQSGLTVLATIPIAKGKPIPFVEDIRKKGSTLFTVTKENRGELVKDVVLELTRLQGQLLKTADGQN